MIFRSRNDDRGPKTVEITIRSGRTSWINGVPAKVVDKMVSAAKWATATTMEFPVKEGGRLYFIHAAVDVIFVRDLPVDSGKDVFHYSEDDEDEDER